MDLIDRQAAINAIDCDIEITGRENVECVARTLQKFIDRIKALPSAERHGRWIPCKERLPEPDTDVLISDNTELLFVGMLDKNSMSWLYEDCILHDLDDVKAWMPLPEPYKVGQQWQT